MFLEDQQKHKRILFHRSDRQLVDSMVAPLKGCRKASKEMFKKRQCMREGDSKNFVNKFRWKSMSLKLSLRIKRDSNNTSIVLENLNLQLPTATIVGQIVLSETNNQVQKGITLYQILGLWIHEEVTELELRRPIQNSGTEPRRLDCIHMMFPKDRKVLQVHSEINLAVRLANIT